MRIRNFWLAAIALFQVGAAQSDTEFVDDYLRRWDAFAQGDDSLVTQLREESPRFSIEMAKLLHDGSPGAPARTVFYVVVQVGGSIPVDSEIGKAISPILGAGFPTVSTDGKPPVYFAADLYFWWLDNASRYAKFALLDDWSNREFARETVISMYQKVRSNP